MTVDRQLGSVHPNHNDIYYSVNYGYVPGLFAPDGEEQDAYILGVDTAVTEFTGKVIAVVHRYDDVEDKLVVASDGRWFTVEEIEQKIYFQEKFFHHEIILLKN